MGKSLTVVKTQYLYVNSTNRRAEDLPCNFKLTIPSGIFHCDDLSQSFKIAVQDFNAIVSWYYVNSTNNMFYVSDGVKTYYFNIPVGNYPYKSLAATIQQTLNSDTLKGFTCTWNSVTNKLTITFPNDGYTYSLGFDLSNSASFIMGFENGQVYPMDTVNLSVTSVNSLKSALSDNICLTVDNLTPSKDCQSVENKDSEVCVPSQNILSIPNNFAPNDVITFVNQNDLFALHVTNKFIDDIEFSIRDEDSNVLQYFTDWRAAIKIETIQHDDGHDERQEMIQSLKDIRDYLKYIFISNHLGNPQ